MLKLAPVPDAGDPPVAVQENVYGVVPPEPATVQVIAIPTVPLAGQLTVTPNGRGAMVIVADAVAVIVFASVAVTETVLLPLTL